MTRRALFGLLAAAALDPERLVWTPGRKLISIPAPLYDVRLIRAYVPLYDRFVQRFDAALHRDPSWKGMRAQDWNLMNGAELCRVQLGVTRETALAFGRKLMPTLPAEVLDVRPGEWNFCDQELLADCGVLFGRMPLVGSKSG